MKTKGAEFRVLPWLRDLRDRYVVEEQGLSAAERVQRIRAQAAPLRAKPACPTRSRPSGEAVAEPQVLSLAETRTRYTTDRATRRAL